MVASRIQVKTECYLEDLTKLTTLPHHEENAEKKAQATIRLGFRSDEQLAVTFKALEPETRGPSTSRFQARVERKDNLLVLHLEARDVSALRAAINSYLSWAVLIRDICLAFEAL